MDMQTSPLALLKDPSLLKTDGLINGEWVKGLHRFDVLDPSNGRKPAPLPLPTPHGPHGAVKPPKNAAFCCASGMTC